MSVYSILDLNKTFKKKKGDSMLHQVKDFVVRQETMLFLPNFDQFGNLSTIVMETDLEFFVEKSPKTLMDACLRYYGSSLRGASDGAKSILGNVNMCPVLMNEKLELYWFPTKSPDKEDCVWFALHHVKCYEKAGLKETKVTLSNGVTVIVDVSLYTFKKKIRLAYQLKCKMEERSKLNSTMIFESKLRYQIRKIEGGLNYEKDIE